MTSSGFLPSKKTLFDGCFKKLTLREEFGENWRTSECSFDYQLQKSKRKVAWPAQAYCTCKRVRSVQVCRGTRTVAIDAGVVLISTTPQQKNPTNAFGMRGKNPDRDLAESSRFVFSIFPIHSFCVTEQEPTCARRANVHLYTEAYAFPSIERRVT